ncbi:Sugar transporter ERD6 14 [Theobroma cacao]|uniref:Sugar transporter ERD6 14 n=1 Tax=Theobroma cacao TaxID=3641 RepID=A0A061F2K5_THECC|nr:Sugar transporter ERD6 14 [Theobroma cacao]
MGEEAATVTQSLLGRRGHGGGGQLQTVSSVTTTLVLSTFVAACISFGFGCVMGYSSPTQSAIMEDLDLSIAEFSLFGSMLNIGSILGALVSGRTTDLLGRKCTMWVLNLFYIMGWFAIAFAKVPWLLDAGRLLLGFRNGIAGYLVPLYVAEITPKNLRGRFSGLVQTMGVIGLSMMYIIGPFFSWRILALIVIIPSPLQLPLLFFIPESPRWLANVGREKEFEKALLSLRGEKVNIFEEATTIKDYTESLKCFSWGGILDLFQRKYAHPLIIGIGLMALQHSGGANAYAYYSGVIFVSAGLSKYIGLSTLAVVEILMSLLDTSLIDKFLHVEYASAASSLEYHSFYSYHKQDYNWWGERTPILALISIWLYMGSYQVGMEGIPWIIVAEIFSINIKGAAGSISSLIGNLFSWIVSYNFNFLFQWSSAGTFFIFSAICGLNAIFAATMVPETKGRTLEEIQASLTSI